MNPAQKKRALWFAAAALLLVALPLVLLFVAHTPAVRGYVLQRAIEWLETQGIQARAKGIDYSLFDGSARLTGVSLAAPGRPPFAVLDSVDVTFHLRPFVLNHIDLRGLRVHYVREADGRDNLPQPKSQGGETNPNAFRIALLTVAASVQVEDRQHGVNALAADCRSELREVTPVSVAALKLNCGKTTAGDFAFDSLAAAGSAIRDLVRIDSLDLRSGPSTASLTGEIRETNRLDLNARLHVDAHPALPREIQSADADLRITGALAEPTVQIVSSTLRSPYGVAEAEGAIAFKGNTSLRAKFREVDLSQFGVSSRVQGTATAQFPGLEYKQAKAHVDATLAPMRGPLPVEGNFAIDAANGAYRITTDSARAAGAEIAGAVTIAANQSLEGKAHVTVPDLAKTLAAFKQPIVPGAAEADLTVGGTVKQPAVTADARVTYRDRTIATITGDLLPLRAAVRADAVPISLFYPINGAVSGNFEITKDSGAGHVSVAGLTAYGENFGRLEADVSLRSKLVQVSNAILRKPAGGEMRAEGSYRLDDASFRFTANGRDLLIENLQLPSGTAHARASFTAEGESAGSQRQIEATFQAADARWNDTAIGRVEGKATLLNDGVTADLQLPDYNATTHAVVGIEAPYPATINATLRNTPITGTPMEGAVSATLSATGELQNWQNADARGEIQSLKLQREGAQLTTVAPAAFALARRTLTLQPLTLTSGQSSVTLRGAVPVAEGAPAADVSLEGAFTAAEAKRFLAAFGQQPPEVDGNAKINLALRGPWRKFVPEGQIEIQNGRYGDFNSVQATATLTPQQLDIASLTASWNESPIQGKGVVPLSLIAPEGWLAVEPAKAPGRIELAWNNTDLAPLLRARNDKLGGRTTGNANIEFRGFGPRDIAGAVTMDTLDLRFGELGFSLEQPAQLSLRNGVARVERLNWKGTAGTLSLHGEAGLLPPQPLRLEANGTLDAAILASFADQLTAGGEAKLQALVTGTVQSPAIAGFLETTNIDASLPQYNVQAENIKSRVDFDGTNIKLTSLTGSVNGGSLHGSGSLRLINGSPEDVRLNLTAANVFLEYPRDLKTAASAALALRSAEGKYTLSGDVQILEGSYNENINFDQFLLRGLTESAAPEEGAKTPIALNIGLRTVSPILVNNNLGKAALNTDLKLLGTTAQPGLSGRITIEEGGELRLNERTYLVDRGTITFTDERRIRPMLDILARTQASGHEITLQVQGEPGNKLDSKLTSDPPLSEPDILSLLVTGRTLDQLSGAEADVTKEQVLSYLTTRVGSELTRTVERRFGISQVRIQPNLIAPEADPSARLTVGQDITRQVRLTYSLDLARTNEQLWLGEWDVTRRFRLRGFRDFDNTYRFELRHEIRFGSVDLGAIATQPREPVRRIGKIEFEGNFYLNAKELADRVKLKSGKPHEFFAVRRGVERIESRYRSKDFHEARVRVERDTKDSTVDLLFRIKEGPQVNIVYEGWTPPSGVRKNVMRIWEQGVFDTGRIVSAMAELRTALIGEGYLQPTVTHQIRQRDEQHKQVLFEIATGPKFDRPQIIVEGAKELSDSRIRRAINSHRPKTDIYLRPQRVADALSRLYHSEGFLDATVAAPKFDTKSVTLTVRVNEGQRFKIGELRFAGSAAVPERELRSALNVESGETYHQERIDAAVQALLQRYSWHGYNDARIEAATKRSGDKLDVEFQIEQGRQTRIAEVRVAGNRRTSANLIRNQSGLRQGEVAGVQKFSDARRNLYSTGAFSLVEIETREVPGPDDQKLLRATITVRELTPFALRYGAFIDNERGPGAIFDFVTRNYLRSARVAGVRGRYDSEIQEVRGYFSQPLLRRFPVGTTSSVYFRRELREKFVADRSGVSIVQESRFKRHYILNYGYRLEKVHTYDRVPDEFLPFDVTLKVAPLQATLTRENRDDILDATRGSFLSQSFEYAPKSLGSDLSFLRYYGQYFHYVPLTKPSEIPWSNGARRPRVIYAGAVRLGVGKGLEGQDLVSSERFYLGGGTTLRGFERDRVGPLDALGDPTGGDSLFLTNHEIRFPLLSIFEGVAFVDAGNIYRRVSQLKPWDLRVSSGMGLRLRTPYFLFRLDYGVNVDPRPGEARAKWFFSIGQTF